MSLDEATQKPHDRLNAYLAADMDSVNVLIRERMASEHAPRIPEVTAHLVEAGGKRLPVADFLRGFELQAGMQFALPASDTATPAAAGH